MASPSHSHDIPFLLLFVVGIIGLIVSAIMLLREPFGRRYFLGQSKLLSQVIDISAYKAIKDEYCRANEIPDNIDWNIVRSVLTQNAMEGGYAASFLHYIDEFDSIGTGQIERIHRQYIEKIRQNKNPCGRKY